MPRAKAATKVIYSNCHLWIYSAKDGRLSKYDDVEIHQRVNPYTDETMDQWYAKSDDLSRIISGLEYSIWYYNGKREYLIWSKTDNDDKVRRLLFKAIKQQSDERVAEALEIIKMQHDILEKATLTFSTSNVQMIAGNYDDVKKAVDNYFYNL